MRPKILAMYLPQFHRTKENDEWWGEGFTEWTTVKGAVSLFDGHEQPVIPSDDRYYDLLEKETMEWQAELLDRYHIDGLCMYHYWFKDGRKILEKPAENLLGWKELGINYCFCWANETWARTWSNWGDSNVWAGKYERGSSYKNAGILLEQSYGGEACWKQHFEYLLPFFQDERYIKIENKPVFMIYRPALILCLSDMVDCWNRWATESGFAGIYFVFANCNDLVRDNASLELIHEPQYTINHAEIPVQNSAVERVYLYEDVTCASLEHYSSHENVSYGGFIGYDDTPRRGIRGTVILQRTPEAFKEYAARLIAKNTVSGSPFLFLNAWNEWGEGMHLEPEKQYGEKYLEGLREASELYKEYLKEYQDKQKRAVFDDPDATQEEESIKQLKKYENYFNLLHHWLLKKEMGRLFADYLKALGYGRIAVYGMGIMGKHLISELQGSDVKIVYAVDNQKEVSANADIPIIKSGQIEEDVDAIIITVTYQYEEIRKQLQEQTRAKIISLEQIVMEC